MAKSIEVVRDMAPIANMLPRQWRENYLGVWAMEEEAFKGLASVISETDLPAHIVASVPDVRAELQSLETDGYAVETTEDGIAVVEINGPTSKAYNSFSRGTSTVLMRKTMRSLARNEDIRAVVLSIDSPGGTVAGQQTFAREVAALASAKPVIAHTEDLAASAAYWTASQATEIYADEMAMVGSIGTFAVVYDMSAAAAMQGIKAIVIRAGKLKGVGTAGEAVSEEAIAKMEADVLQMNSFFLDAVQQGRGLSRASVELLATGEVFIGEAAVSNGLVDGIMSFDEAVERARSVAAPRPAVSKQRGTPMSASIQELREACPGASADFILEQASSGHTVEQARADFIALQQLEAEELRSQLASAEAEAERRLDLGTDGIAAIAGDGAAAEPVANAEDEWKAELAKLEARGMSRKDAARKLAVSNPDLRTRFLETYNARHEAASEARRRSLNV